tara:strand:+ start:356 stop:1159 length:804 start_codon:yes stop_codon:yes gene_type:complete
MNKLYYFFLFFTLLIFNESVSGKEKDLLSYQSVYEISLDNSKERKNTFGKPVIKEANGELLMDWFNNCNSWSSNQRMFINFVNSSGVGTVTDINYSLTEKNSSTSMDFALQVKENNLLVQRVNGRAERKKNINIQLFDPDEKNFIFDNDVLFPHQHLKLIIEKLGTEKNIFSHKLYEGSLPEKYLNISTFISQESVINKSKFIPKEIDNIFWDVRMAYYEEKKQVPEMELTLKLNKQGVITFYKYDYPDYSLIMKLKKIIISPSNCN